MVPTQDQIDSLNERLSDLQLFGNLRFSIEDFTDEIMIYLADDRGRCYDNNVPLLKRRPSWDEVEAAISSRFPPLDPRDAINAFEYVEFLSVQLQAERLLYHRNSLSASNALSVGGTLSLNLSSDGDMIPSDTGKLRFLLQRMCREMCVEDAAVFLLGTVDMCGALALQCNEVTQRLPETYLRDPPRILRDEEYGHLNDAQLALLRNINKALVEDFSLRRKMLLTRVDVTLKSFLWSEKAVGHEVEIGEAIREYQQLLTEAPTIYDVEDALSAPVALMHIHSKKITGSSTYVTNDSIVKKVRIGVVPDRGGRPMAENRVKAALSEGKRWGGGGRGSGRNDGDGGRGKGDGGGDGGRGKGNGGRGGGDGGRGKGDNGGRNDGNGGRGKGNGGRGGGDGGRGKRDNGGRNDGYGGRGDNVSRGGGRGKGDGGGDGGRGNSAGRCGDEIEGKGGGNKDQHRKRGGNTGGGGKDSPPHTKKKGRTVEKV